MNSRLLAQKKSRTVARVASLPKQRFLLELEPRAALFLERDGRCVTGQHTQVAAALHDLRNSMVDFV